MERFVEVILPLPIYSTFTYAVPEALIDKVVVGGRVLVQFGKKKFYTAIVESVHSQRPEGYEVKPFVALLDEEPIVRYPQLKFWHWIADYYLCAVGDVYKAAVPTGLKPESETFISLNPDFEFDSDTKLSEHQAAIVQLLEQKKRLRVSEIEQETGFRNIVRHINPMLTTGLIEIDEHVVEKYHPRKESFVRLTADRSDHDRLHEFFALVSRSQRQEKLLVAYLDMSRWLSVNSTPAEVGRQQLLEKSGATPGILKALVDKGIFEVYRKSVNRFKSDTGVVAGTPELPQLSEVQNTALQQIRTSFTETAITLLHGVTGSGKTEIYTHLINETLQSGSQVLFLVPEISLTTQLTDRLRRIFGNRLIVYHSKFSDAERVDIWRRLLTSVEPMVILGVRSSVFLPFARLGLIIVDEEHEASFKQYDPAPRYNARDAALVLASMHGAKTLLGSATPAVETYYKATTGKYGLVTLDVRYRDAQLPEVEIVDMKAMRKRKEVKGILSSTLRLATDRAMADGKQAIMFQNRRGFAPVVVCRTCGWTPKCQNCDVSLVYHKNSALLRCHYCGYSRSLPALCPACGDNAIEIYGYGTERIAEEVHREFEGHRVARMDLDTTRNKDAYQEIIEEFARHDTDILVGTQMVTKGLDFENVRVVGVLNADTLLNFPDFRSNERAFNMLEQVAGRAGRRADKGHVIIQTTAPDHPVLTDVKHHDYSAYYARELEDRQRYAYPPFTRIINIYIKHKDAATVDALAVTYTLELRKVFGDRVLGPEKPLVSRVATWFLQSVMLKIEANASMRKVKDLLRSVTASLASDSRLKSAVIYYDVDPV
ncbi:MAG: primosomal protein N' [Muribaculaceae bacterium]|nr:primosomal protein N' [Muribaculaceae bacterium]